MEYNINPSVFTNVFVFPVMIADKYLKLCKGEHLKVLLYILRTSTNKPSVEEISSALDLSVYDVEEAILFWADAGILLTENVSPVIERQKTVKKSLKPSRDDVAKRGLEDIRIKTLLNETQLKFGRGLKTNETQTLVWLFDDLGLDVSLILLIVQHAVDIGKKNIRYIESVATDWLDKGIETIEQAEEEFRKMALCDKAWTVVCKAFGIERRKPSKKEESLSLLWINDWKISPELLKEAYDACIDAKSKYSFPYIAKIIENWHTNGYTKPEDIKPKEKVSDSSTVTFDVDLYKKMLNSKD